MSCEHDRGLRRCAGLVAAVYAATILAVAQPSAMGTVEVTVTRVGFPTLSGHVMRNGAWTPVTVDLDLINQSGFDGSLRLAQFDNDGDECFDTVDVHLRAETNSSETVTLYIPANPAWGRGRFIVELLGDKGETVQVLSQGELTYQATPPQQPTAISDDGLLILSLGTGTMGRVRDLVDLEKRVEFARPGNVGHLSPSDLPGHWIGLEAVDYIVWDDARPEDLTDRQLKALLEWIRQGGTILIAASRTAPSLVLTDGLDAILPVDIGEVVSADNLRDVRYELLAAPTDEEGRQVGKAEWLSTGFPRSVPVVRCTLREGATRIVWEESVQSEMVTRGQSGRGRIIFCAVTLRDLFSAPGGAARLFEDLFGLAKWGSTEMGAPEPRTLFRHVASVISFATSGSLYLFVAGVSSIGYVIVATFGTWGFLTARGWRRYSWSALAVVAIVASIVALVVVRTRQGFGETLRQIAVIDADAGSPFGRATVLFGLKTSTDKELDVWLPSDPIAATEPGETTCFLRPLPAPSSLAEATGFADPEEYRVIPTSAVVDNVRIRATLKQFEGRWDGPLGGQLSGEIHVSNRLITEDSYIINDLGVDLTSCWLLHADPVAGTLRDDLRCNTIYAYDLGPLPASGQKTMLHPLCYPPGSTRTPAQVRNASTLGKRQTDWNKEFSSLISGIGFGQRSTAAVPLGAEQKALMLLSTVGDFDPTLDASMVAQITGPITWSRDRLRRLDLRDQLRPDSAVLIGFTSDPGPIRLFHRTRDRSYRPLVPEERYSKAMYRIHIPVTLRGGGGKGSEADEEDVLGLGDS